MIPAGGDKIINPNSLKKMAPLKAPKSYDSSKFKYNIISYIGLNNIKYNNKY